MAATHVLFRPDSETVKLAPEGCYDFRVSVTVNDVVGVVFKCHATDEFLEAFARDVLKAKEKRDASANPEQHAEAGPSA